MRSLRNFWSLDRLSIKRLTKEKGMAKNDGLRQFIAGVFLLLGLAITAGVIFFIGYERGFTEPKFPMAILFDKVGGLNDGAPVRLSGVTVGTVTSIDFLDREVQGRGVKVSLDIYQKFANAVRRCTKVSVLTEGVLGAKYVEMGRDPDDMPLDISRPVLGEPMLDVYDLAEVLQSTATSFNETTRGINVMVSDLKAISRKTKRLLDRIEQRAIDGNLFKVF
jgi:phospholipid/cholesterol/gamma-HCH transport system substrate-binding protein